MLYKNLTIRGKTDGFGCQLNAKFSGIAFCENTSGRYRYIHTPFTSVSHGYGDYSEKINQFIGIPDMRNGRKIHVVYRFMRNVFSNPSAFYTNRVLTKIRDWYWKDKTKSDVDIVVHIRRGDCRFHKSGIGRFMNNTWYNRNLPSILIKHPDNYKITIHSEGDISEFESITDGWPNSITDRIVWKLGENYNPECENNMLAAFHDMCSAKVFIQSKSGLSYTSAILNDGIVYFKTGSNAIGQKYPINGWNLLT